MGDSKKETRDERLKFAFGSHSKVHELHVTSDDQMFTNKDDAKIHAATLEDNTVDTEKRSDHIKVASPAEKIAEKVWTERELLFKEHEELFGAPPAKTASTAKVKEKIEAEKIRLHGTLEKDILAAGADSDPDPTEGNDPEGEKDPEGNKEN